MSGRVQATSNLSSKPSSGGRLMKPAGSAAPKSSSAASNRKVDIINTSDEDTETEEDDDNDDDSLAKGKTGDNKDDEKRPADAPPAEELLRTKRPRFMKPFTDDLLVSDHGISRIYHEFPLNAKFTTRGSEATYLQRLITMYKGWAFQLHPGVSFQDVLLKCETLGSKGKVRNTLQHMRERERDRYIDNVLLPAMNLPPRDSAMTSPPSSSYAVAEKPSSGATTTSGSVSVMTSPPKSVRIQEASLLSSTERSTRSKASPAANEGSSNSARRVLNNDDDEEFDFEARPSSSSTKETAENDEDSIFGTDTPMKTAGDDLTTQEQEPSQEPDELVFSPEKPRSFAASPPSIEDREFSAFSKLDEETEIQEAETATQPQMEEEEDDDIATQQQ